MNLRSFVLTSVFACAAMACATKAPSTQADGPSTMPRASKTGGTTPCPGDSACVRVDGKDGDWVVSTVPAKEFRALHQKMKAAGMPVASELETAVGVALAHCQDAASPEGSLKIAIEWDGEQALVITVPADRRTEVCPQRLGSQDVLGVTKGLRNFVPKAEVPSLR